MAKDHGLPAAVARLYWMLAGNALVGFLAASIAQHPPSLSWRDLAFWAAVAALVVVRFIDVTRLGGSTADGQPATLSHWRRYSTGVLAIGAGLWAAAHLIALWLGA